MNYVPLVVSAFLAMGSLTPDESRIDKDEWRAFKMANNKVYESEGIEQMRKLVYAHNKQLVAQHNAAENKTFELGLNHLADMAPPEVRQVLNGFKGAELKAKMRAGQLKLRRIQPVDKLTVPNALDWRKVPGRVSSVKDQGQCGSCWAFAAIGGLEGQEATVSNTSHFGAADLVDLSVQNLVDCDETNWGCDGGFMPTAYEFIRQQGGINSHEDYPYEATQGECRFREDKVVMSDLGAALLPEGDEEALKQEVATFGPVAVAIDASQPSFQLYRRGVFKARKCGKKPEELDHAVLVVGYGSDRRHGDFWIVKNSWGQDWGEKGYIRMARNEDNMCGIATFPVVPLL